MSVIDFIEKRVLEASLNYENLEEIILETNMYKELLIEIDSTLRVAQNKDSYFSSNKLTFNSINGPIEIKRGKNNRQDPNNILKEIL